MVAFLDMLRGSTAPPTPTMPTGVGSMPNAQGPSPDVLSAILAMLSRGEAGMGGLRPSNPTTMGAPAPNAPSPAGPAQTPSNGPGFLGGSTGSQTDLSGPWDDIAGLAAGLLLGPIGTLGAGIARGATRLGNAGFADRARGSWGQEPLSFGQNLAAALGLNSYGEGGRTDRLGEFNGTPVSPGGTVRNGGFLGFGGSVGGAYTPGEAQKREAARRYGGAFGGTWGGNRGGGGGQGYGRGLNGNTSTGRVAGPV